MHNFDSLLQSDFSLAAFRKGQKEIITDVIDQKDVLAVLPTGGGKSLCFQFPAVYSKKLVVVISPLIALMKDQVASLQKKGIASGCIHSGQSLDEKRKVFSDISKGGAYLLYLSPERVQKEGFQNWIKKANLALFAIDEAHCVSQWGHDFREEYKELHCLKELRPDVPILALTASATPTVLNDISKQLQLNAPSRRVHGFYRPNLYYQVENCADEAEKRSFLLSAISKTTEGRAIIYCGTRKVTEEIADSLSKTYEKVGYYHAGLAPSERTKTQEAYAKGDLRILVATNAFGMGIDQPDVRTVVHYQMPSTIDSLYQEMGRAGRDDAPSTCLMLYSKKDKGLQSYFIQTSTAPAPIKNARWNNLDALINYAEGSECRHAEILTYYKDSQRIKSCTHCDSCVPESPARILRPKREAAILKKPVTRLKKSKTALTSIDSHAFSLEQEALFLSLKKWRKEKAEELDSPAFIIFSDKTLRDLARRHPSNSDGLKEVHGIGDAKLEKFGSELLAVLGEH